jgi:hypothetical protein
VEKDFTCQWGIAFKVGDVVVGGKYYKNGAHVKVVMFFS